MALPTTNLSLNAIHVEIGGTTGTQCSLNDADIRGIATTDAAYDGGDGINQTSGTQVSIGEFRNASDTAAATVSLPADATSIHNTSTTANPTYSGVELNTSGTAYEYNANGTQGSSLGTWLTSGSSSDCWVECIVNSGTLGSGSSPSGSGTYSQLSSTRTWNVQDNNSGPTGVSLSITLNVYSDNTGSNLLDTETYTPFANYSSGGP